MATVTGEEHPDSSKVAVAQLEQDVVPNTAKEWHRKIAGWSSNERTEKEKKLIKRIDRRLMPILIVMYIMNYIDRNALPQARVQGLETDLGLKGDEYNIVLSITFIGYILMQIPSNMILGSITRPSWYLAGVMILWGLVSGCSGATESFGGIAACRFILGVTEAPFFAGVAFLFSGWYTRKELGMRLGVFFCGAMFSGAFGGLFAAGISAAFKHNKIHSWRWLFIIEGAATIVFATATAFIIPDWPTTTKWLSEEEKALAVMRLVEDAGEEEHEIKTSQAFKMAVKDYRIWLCILNQVCAQAVASLTNFLPTLIKAFGYNTVNTQLLTAPPYVVTGCFCLFNSWYSDRTSKRSPHIVYPSVVALVGIIITMATTATGPRYFALFLMLPGTYGCFQISNAWMANIAARPQRKRAIGMAMNNSLGNTALVWTPYLYPASDGPHYTMAWGVNLGLTVVTIVSSLVLSVCLKRDNKKLEQADALVGVVDDAHVEKTGQTELIEVSGRKIGGALGKTARFQV